MSDQGPVTLTPSIIDQAIRLETIFAPQTRVLHDKKFRADNPDETKAEDARIRFARYTSAETAIRILNSKRLWMRSTTCMIDYREVELGYGHLIEYFGQPEKRGRFLNPMNAVIE